MGASGQVPVKVYGGVYVWVSQNFTPFCIGIILVDLVASYLQFFCVCFGVWIAIWLIHGLIVQKGLELRMTSALADPCKLCE